MIPKKKVFFFKFLIWIYPLKKKNLKFCFRYELQKMFVFIITQMEIRNNLLHLSRVMTRPVQYTYNRCQFVTRSGFIYAIRWARLLLPGFPLPTYSSNKNCTFIHCFTCTIIWFTGENVLSAANFKFFFVWIFSNSYFFYLPVHVFY